MIRSLTGTRAIVVLGWVCFLCLVISALLSHPIFKRRFDVYLQHGSASKIHAHHPSRWFNHTNYTSLPMLSISRVYDTAYSAAVKVWLDN
jgi:hypothetical protein